LAPPEVARKPAVMQSFETESGCEKNKEKCFIGVAWQATIFNTTQAFVRYLMGYPSFNSGGRTPSESLANIARPTVAQR
jgi:hypothetical protein